MFARVGVSAFRPKSLETKAQGLSSFFSANGIGFPSGLEWPKPEAEAGSLIDVQPSQERLPRADRFFEDQNDGSNSEPHRDSEEIVRAFSADEPACVRARGRGSAVGVQVGVSDQRFPGELVARVHRVFDRDL